MIGFAVRTLSTLASTVAVAYVVFFVPVGSKTLAQHVARIAATEPARELGREVAASGKRVSDVILQQVHAKPTATDGGVGDAAPVPTR